MMKTFAAAAVVVALCAAPALAQQNATQQHSASSQQNLSAQQFVNKAAVGGMFEVQSSRWILANAKPNQAEAKFAQRMIHDHSLANGRLEQIARTQNLSIPTKLDQQHQQLLHKIKTAGNKMQTYDQVQLQAHKNTIDTFQQYAQNGQNQALVTFAKNTLPTLHQHLQLAQQLPGVHAASK